MTGDVFKEHPLWGTFADNPGDIGPKVAGIVCAIAFASGAERLAGISGEDDVESPAEGSGIECSQIIPDRGRSEIPRGLGGDKHSSGPVLPFDEGAGVITGLSEHEAQIKASAACAEGQSVPGT